MGRRVRSRIARVLVFLVSAGVAAADEPLSRGRPEVEQGIESAPAKTIYGTDDRIEFYQATSDTERAVFETTAALFWLPDGFLTPAGDHYLIDGTYTLSEYVEWAYGYPLCASEPYQDQPTPPFCSGSMVGHDLIATAGHCIRNTAECHNTAFVFGFYMLGASAPVGVVPTENVYQCAEIVGRVQTKTEDWAVLRTDRPIVDRTPIPIRRESAVEDDLSVAELAVCGHPLGLPAKYASNAELQVSYDSYFEADLDTFAGNSGSAVVSLDDLGNAIAIEGILVRGNVDFELVSGSGRYCIRSVVCPSSGCTGTAGSGWEEVTRSSTFADLVPPVSCGDAVCDPNETCESCPLDCGECPPYCGDGVCDGLGFNEDCQSCPADCPGRVHPHLGLVRCCGNGVCEQGESSRKCPADCGP